MQRQYWTLFKTSLTVIFHNLLLYILHDFSIKFILSIAVSIVSINSNQSSNNANILASLKVDPVLLILRSDCIIVINISSFIPLKFEIALIFWFYIHNYCTPIFSIITIKPFNNAVSAISCIFMLLLSIYISISGFTSFPSNTVSNCWQFFDVKLFHLFQLNN